MKSKSEALFTTEVLQRYAIEDGESGLDNVLQNNDGKIPAGGLISVKSSRKYEKENGSHMSDKKRRTDSHHHKSSNKRKKGKGHE